MSRSSAVEAAMFKRVPDGFVFRAPTLWPFGRGRFLLADESRKAEIVARVAGPGRWKLLLAFVVWTEHAVLQAFQQNAHHRQNWEDNDAGAHEAREAAQE